MSFLRVIVVLALVAAPAHASAQEAAKLAKLIEVSEGNASVTRQFFGRVVARETADLAFQADGQIVEFPIIEGEVIAWARRRPCR